MEVRCTTSFGIRKCNKYLGTFEICIAKIYCKSCKKSNYYEVVTKEGLRKAKHL